MKFTVSYIKKANSDWAYYVVLFDKAGNRYVGDKAYKTQGWAERAGYKLGFDYVPV